jgi:hypothetical protein
VTKRRELISLILTSVLGGTSGCLNILENEDDDKKNRSDNIPEEEVFLGSDSQLNIRILDPQVDYTYSDRNYIYQGERYAFEEFASIISLDYAENRIRSYLSESSVSDNNIFVEEDELNLSKVKNPEIRSEFEVERFDEESVCVKYIIRVSEGSIIDEPSIQPEELLDKIPHSVRIIIQFDRRPYEAVIPVNLRVTVSEV